MRKYCRLCWNTRYWREPTGEAAKIEGSGSFVAKIGFGHEEWLFDFSWLQRAPGKGQTMFKYGFMQPINRGRAALEGKTMDVLAYALAPNKTRVAVAHIRDL